MKQLIAVACLGFALMASAPAFAGAQQEKMKGCNKEATGMKGDERKAFMKKCLSKEYTLKEDGGSSTKAAASTDPAAASSQQNKMKTCNAEAKTKALVGDARKAFMSSCLKS
jgi:hypothetical protein